MIGACWIPGSFFILHERLNLFNIILVIILKLKSITVINIYENIFNRKEHNEFF